MYSRDDTSTQIIGLSYFRCYQQSIEDYSNLKMIDGTEVTVVKEFRKRLNCLRTEISTNTQQKDVKVQKTEAVNANTIQKIETDIPTQLELIKEPHNICISTRGEINLV